MINKQFKEDKSCVKKDSKFDLLTIRYKHKADYFIAGPRKEADRIASGKTTHEIHNDNIDVFSSSGIGCFKATFSLQVKENKNPYKVLPWHVAYTLPKAIQERIRVPQTMTNDWNTGSR